MIGAPVYGDVRLDDNISVPTEMWGSRTKAWAIPTDEELVIARHTRALIAQETVRGDVIQA